MGNSSGRHHFIELVHPTTLAHSVHSTGGYIGRCEGGDPSPPHTINWYNQVDCACGCGGTITFTRSVKTLQMNYRCMKTFRSNFGITVKSGATVSVSKTVSQDEGKADSAVARGMTMEAAAEWGCSREEVEEHCVMTEYKIDDNNEQSILYVYHCYYGYDFVRFQWLKNELHLMPYEDQTFEYEGLQYLKVHPNSCEGSETRVEYSEKSTLRMQHECRKHRAFISVTFDPKYVDSNGNYTGRTGRRCAPAEQHCFSGCVIG